MARTALSEPQKEAARQATRRWCLKNKDKVREANRRWRLANPEKRRQQQQRWLSNSKEKRQEYRRRRLDRLTTAFETGIRQRAESKCCSLCKVVKPADQFYFSNNNPDGLHGWCKPCSDRRVVEGSWKRNHDLSPTDYKLMLGEQEDRCAICRIDKSRAGKRIFCVDHDHVTGKVRGLLCTRCNTMIGNAKDDVTILKAAISYLEKANAHQR